jgi:protein-disulfide isomerase
MPNSKQIKQKQKAGTGLQKLTVLTGIAVIALVVILIGYQQWNQNKSAEPSSSGPVDFLLKEQPYIGSESAAVTVIAFEDFKCPVCKQFETTVFSRLLEEYVNTGKIRFYFINYQFIAPDSVTAGIAGECVYKQNNAAFWDFKRAIYEAQGPEHEIWATPTRLKSLMRANVSDIDYVAFDQCLDSRDHAKLVEGDQEIGNRAGVGGTPTIFVNGKKQPNWFYETIKVAIEKEL